MKMELTGEKIQEIKDSIEKYKTYLNDGQYKPDWRIDEVQSYINVFQKIIDNKGIENGKDGRTN